MKDFFENLLSNGELQKENAELKAENDKLKEENDRLNRNLIEALKHEKEALNVSIKYKDALQEIKDFVNSSRNKLIYLITKVEEE